MRIVILATITMFSFGCSAQENTTNDSASTAATSKKMPAPTHKETPAKHTKASAVPQQQSTKEIPNKEPIESVNSMVTLLVGFAKDPSNRQIVESAVLSAVSSVTKLLQDDQWQSPGKVQGFAKSVQLLQDMARQKALLPFLKPHKTKLEATLHKVKEMKEPEFKNALQVLENVVPALSN